MDDNLNTQQSAKPPIKTPDGLSPLERDISASGEAAGPTGQAEPSQTPPGVAAEPQQGGTPPTPETDVPLPADEVPADQPIASPSPDEGTPPAPEGAEKSPEPAAVEPVAPGQGESVSPPGGPSSTEPAPEPPTPPPAGGTESNKPVDLPDTDEFLKNIMGEEQKNSPPANGPEPPQEPPPSPYGGTPSGEESPEPEGGTPSSEPYGAEKPGGAVNGVSPAQSGEQGVSNDIVGAMQKAPAKDSKNALKLVGLIILAVILVIGGYVGYRALFAPATPTTTTKPTTVSSTPTATSQSLDDTRKSDLQSIAEALKSYKAASGKYPVSETLVLLTDTSNPLTKELVPTYLTTMPSDPNVSKSYGYKSDGTTFVLSTVLDSTKDPDGVLEGGKYLYKVTESTVTSSASLSPTATVTSGAASSPAGESNLPI